MTDKQAIAGSWAIVGAAVLAIFANRYLSPTESNDPMPLCKVEIAPRVEGPNWATEIPSLADLVEEEEALDEAQGGNPTALVDLLRRRGFEFVFDGWQPNQNVSFVVMRNGVAHSRWEWWGVRRYTRVSTLMRNVSMLIMDSTSAQALIDAAVLHEMSVVIYPESGLREEE